MTQGGVPFPHLALHLVLVYSNVEAIHICFSESYESLVEGFETHAAGVVEAARPRRIVLSERILLGPGPWQNSAC